ncbi:MAG: hypothetical protein ACRDS9_11955 [Pseudonocardiaceae bacterium]
MNTEKRENVDYVPPGQTTWPIMGMPRRVRVKGRAGVDATVVVTVVRDTVWLSISPPFNWEAIMEPGKVDEVISMLARARDEAKKVATARNGSAFRAGQVVVRASPNDGSATQ